MRLKRLQIAQVRSISSASLDPAPAFNLVTGANGAGKTSLLESVHLLAYGRSFRGRVRDGLVRTGATALEVFAEWEETERNRRVGLRHTGQQWEGRLDGEKIALLGDLCAALAVVTFEPGSHALVDGHAEPRRRFLDWGLFHVENGFLSLWRRYNRALKQRNALLKRQVQTSELDSWDHELAITGELLDRERRRYLERLQEWLQPLSQELLEELGEARIDYHSGWRRDALSLADALLLARGRDLTVGFTSVGPHRADWKVSHAMRPGQEMLSRGQAKLTALACLLAQAEEFAAARGDWPVILLDDLASELDQLHQRRLLQRLRHADAQFFVTGTDVPASLMEEEVEMMRFHVEHGVVRTCRAG